MAFCKNCGAQVGDDERFCPNCGQAMGDVPVRKPAQGGNFVGDLLGQLKGFFSKNPLTGALKAVKSNGFEWSAIAGAFIIIFALGMMVTVAEMGSRASKGLNMVPMATLVGASRMMNYGAIFGMSLVVALLIWGGLLGITFLFMKMICKLNVTFNNVANLVSYITIPVICAFVINMLFALIWVPFACMVLATAIMIALFILFNAMKQLSGKEAKIWVYAAMFFCIVAFTALMCYLLWVLPSTGNSGSMYVKKINSMQDLVNYYGW